MQTNVTGAPATTETNNNPAPAPAAATSNANPPIDGGITLADHNAALDKVRREEKEKLYGDLQAARKQVETLSASVQKLESEKANLQTIVDSTKASVTADGKSVDVAKLIAEVSERAAKAVADNAKVQITQLTSQLNDLQGQLAQTRLKETRERLIAEAGGQDAIIPELVKGNTEEELRASIAASKEILDKQKARFGVTTTPPAPSPAGTQVAPAPAPLAPPPATPAPLETGSSVLRPLEGTNTRMTPAEWRQVREQRLAAAQGRYPTR